MRNFEAYRKNILAHSYGCLMVKLPAQLAKKVLALSATIPDEFIFEGDDGDMGREDSPHITIKYGLHTGDTAEVTEKMEHRWPIKAKLGKASIFEADDYIVLKMAVSGTPLRALNKYVCSNFECTDKFPAYNPHATIAYLTKNPDNPDYWKEFASDELSGEEFEVDEVEWSPADGGKEMIPLNAERPAARVARIAGRVAMDVLSNDKPGRRYTTKDLHVAAYSKGEPGRISYHFGWEVFNDAGKVAGRGRGATRAEALKEARGARKKILNKINSARGAELEKILTNYGLV